MAYEGHNWGFGPGPGPEQEGVRNWLREMDDALVAVSGGGAPGGAPAGGLAVVRFPFAHDTPNLATGVPTGVTGNPGDALLMYASYFDVTDTWDNAMCVLWADGDDPETSMTKLYLWQPSHEEPNARQENSAMLGTTLTFKTAARLMLRVDGAQATGAATLVAVIAKA